MVLDRESRKTSSSPTTPNEFIRRPYLGSGIFNATSCTLIGVDIFGKLLFGVVNYRNIASRVPLQRVRFFLGISRNDRV